jgi:hypothetical protein
VCGRHSETSGGRWRPPGYIQNTINMTNELKQRSIACTNCLKPCRHLHTQTATARCASERYLEDKNAEVIDTANWLHELKKWGSELHHK